MTSRGRSAPATVIGAIMGEVLCTSPLAPDEDFWARGGDSLRATQVVNRLVQHYSSFDSETAAELQAGLLLSIFDDASPATLELALRRLLPVLDGQSSGRREPPPTPPQPPFLPPGAGP